MSQLSQVIVSGLGNLLFQQLQSLIVQVSPTIATAVIGIATYQASSLAQKYKKRKDVELAAAELEAVKSAAYTLVASLYEKDATAYKLDTACKGIPAKVRKETAVAQLKELYPKISEQFIDSVVDSVVFEMKPSKPKKKVS
jgi:hypothetical protein